jgi:hypothetical protein
LLSPPVDQASDLRPGHGIGAGEGAGCRAGLPERAGRCVDRPKHRQAAHRDT